ncbi:MAG: gliding motility-associated C-terminal domain-containing protein [Taibaiella sp.]|nr:gliding motility-associated C-terminal domain-containing protein [Taibaiella sp.]
MYGGDLLYRHISDNLYEVKLTVYGDCSGGAFPNLKTSVPNIFIYRGGTYFAQLPLTLQMPYDGVEVSPVCPSQLINTSCKGGTLPGVTKFVYLDTVELPVAASNWRFIFSGSFGAGGLAGRTQAITNVYSPGTTLTYLEATLNNTVDHNSSPDYTTIPTPFYCKLPDQQYNQGAVDGNGDSLSYQLVTGKAGNQLNPLLSDPLVYNSGLSGELPLETDSGAFFFNEFSGQLTFTPNRAQNSLVVCQVNEYRNGVLVGTSQREMTFIVAPDCEGIPPTFKVVNLSAGAVTRKSIVNICVGTEQLNFDINTLNPGGDSTTIIARGIPEGATLNISNNNTPYPSINFAWTTKTIAPGVYNFYLDISNNHCPIAYRQTLAYSINITPFPIITATPVAPTRCVHQAFVQYDLTLGYVPRFVTVEKDGKTFLSYTDSTGIIRDSLPVGNYHITARCDDRCFSTYDLSIIDSGILPLPAVIDTYCQRDIALPLQMPLPGDGAVITWYDGANNALPDAPTPSTALPGVYTWYVQSIYKVCTSAHQPAEAIIHPLPVPQVLTTPARLCLGDTLILEASGGKIYTWTPTEQIMWAGDKPFIRLTTPTRINLKAETEFGCVDSTYIDYRQIEPCCQFMYPNSFTPNGDGLNDRFRISTPGNLRGYKLTIYNRWGQVVFMSASPGESWDGHWNGAPAEMGTYYYYFEGMCLTGNIERHYSDLTLIR